MNPQNYAANIALSVALCVSASFAATPIGWWSMDSLDAQGRVPDLSGNNRPLALNGNVCITNDAVSGMALCNPGNTINSCAQFQCPGDIKARSISMWVKLESDDGTYSYSTGDNAYPHLFNNFSNMRLLWNYNATAPAATLNAGDASVSVSFVKPRGNWSHLVVTIGNVAADESTADFTVYQDGVMTCSASNSTLAANWRTVGSTTVALAGNGGNRTIRGVIDEVKVYDVALTPLEVQEEFERFTNPDSVFGHWTMEDSYTDGGKVYVNDAFGRQTLQLQGGAVLTNADHWTSQAIYFDGTDSTCAFTDAKRIAQSLTFAAWTYIPNDRTPGDILSGNKYPRMFSTLNGTKAYPSAETTKFNMEAYFGSDNVSGNNVLASKTHWTHVALVYDVGRDTGGLYYVVRFYRNGQKVSVGAKKYVAERSGGIFLSPKGDFDTVRIGGDGSTRPFYGYMDDVWMFCRALDDAEVRRLYCGASPVSAGVDFTVAAATATLSGMRNPATNFVHSISEYGATSWSLVSAPEGGEGATIAMPNQLVTTVTLPVEGSYVFRLTNTGDFGEFTDEVTVTRISGTPSIPSLTLSAASADVRMPEPVYLTATTSGAVPRYFWSKKSGPGGVYFNDATAAKPEAIFTVAGAYVLSCTVEAGGASASADIAVTVDGAADCSVPGTERGLVAYWNFDSAPLEEFSQTRYTPNGFAQAMKSKIGMGIGVAPQSASAVANINSGVTLPAAQAGTAMFWMYDDSVNKYSDDKYCRLWNGGQFEVQYDNNNVGVESSMSITVKHDVGQDTFTVPISVANLRKGTRRGRWSHCAVVFDFSAYTNTVATYATDSLNRLRVYVDGEAFAPSSCTTSATNDTGTLVMIAPKTLNTSSSLFLGNSSNNRYFPGVLDEIRYYTNALTQAEIRRFAWEFAVHNRAPIVEVPALLKATAHHTVQLGGAAYDDGTSTLSAKWKVVSGESAKVTFEDETSLTSAVTFAKAGSYTLRLVVSDGELVTESNDLVCDVAPNGFCIIYR